MISWIKGWGDARLICCWTRIFSVKSSSLIAVKRVNLTIYLCSGSLILFKDAKSLTVLEAYPEKLQSKSL